jgi:hypothetical protein
MHRIDHQYKRTHLFYLSCFTRKLRIANAVQTKNVEDLSMLLVEAMNADRHDREESSRQYNRDAALMLAVRSRDPRLVEPLVEKVRWSTYSAYFVTEIDWPRWGLR